MTLGRHSLSKKRAQEKDVVYYVRVQTVKTVFSMVPNVPVSELGSGYRWLIHWWPFGPRLVAYVRRQIAGSER
jgi:hypothetical protein